MRVADVGCGSGKTSQFLHKLVQPGGAVLGIDASRSRIRHAQERYGASGVSFVCRDFYRPLQELGSFDFIWVRFVLEYHRARCRELVGNLVRLLNPGGILFLADLDNNCLGHYGLPQRLQHALDGVMQQLESAHDFDPYVGRKLYACLYDEGLEQIEVKLEAHHLIYGALNDIDRYNWTKKIEVAARNSGYGFPEYPDGYDEFMADFRIFFSDPRRFSYTPLIMCKGRRPLA